MKQRSVVITTVMAAALFGFSLAAWLKPEDPFSYSERRELAGFPKLSWETVKSGEFMDEFEEYVLDQFPMRDAFRRLKAEMVFRGFGQKDNNDIYVVDGYASKMDYPLNQPMLDHAAERFDYLYETYLGEAENIYLSIVPDKNYFLAEDNGYLALDYDAMIRTMKEKLSYMTYVDITGHLDLEDYYDTDSHWRQEALPELARHLAGAMGVELKDGYEVETLDLPFYGVYYGQSALPLEPDQLKYLTSEALKQCTVTCYDTGKPVELPLYDMEKAAGKDPYEMFLSGTRAVMTIENPQAQTEKELIVFRDSFGSSLIPLLAEGYRKITVLDIRYVQSSQLGQVVEFGNQDVLFLYSTMLLNNSMALR